MNPIWCLARQKALQSKLKADFKALKSALQAPLQILAKKVQVKSPILMAFESVFEP